MEGLKGFRQHSNEIYFTVFNGAQGIANQKHVVLLI